MDGGRFRTISESIREGMQVANDAAVATVAMSPQMAAALVAGIISVLTGVLAAIITVVVAERKLRRDYRLEFAAENVAHRLMMRKEWRWRSFRIIRHYLGGFEDDELRRILVRAGGIRSITPKGIEVWGLLSRVEEGVILPSGDPVIPEGVPNKLFGEQ